MLFLILEDGLTGIFPFACFVVRLDDIAPATDGVIELFVPWRIVLGLLQDGNRPVVSRLVDKVLTTPSTATRLALKQTS